MWRKGDVWFFQPREPVFDSNTVIIDDEELVIIDPGTESREYFKEVLEETGNSFNDVDIVFYTHGHYDHFEGTNMFPDTEKIAFHPDGKRIEDKMGFEVEEMKEETTLSFGNLSFKVLHTPGHSEGSCSLYLPDKLLICGDLVFANGSFGRTDLEGGSREKLKNSLEKLIELDFEYLLPGHREIGNKESVKRALENIDTF